MAAHGDSFTDERFKENLLGDLINRAVARGEIDEKRLTPLVNWVPTGLVLTLTMISGKTPSDESIAAIVDQVFLPIVSTTERRKQ